NIDCQFNTRSQSIPFKADGYRITKPLKEYTEKLLSYSLTLKAVACDMNSDFEEAFKGRYPKLDIVYDRFHIIKNFNDKVVSE
ncbi:transposase, partial [Lactobacillus delbrueckii subsp. lactis]|uniref:transposase n=1 Tax=Lactobacillus delbrueckii TaxID=1584 RepID=UPI001E40567E